MESKEARLQTRSKESLLTVEWEIEHFMLCTFENPKDYIESPKFPVHNENGKSFCMRLYPRYNEEYISIYLLSEMEKNVLVKEYTISLINGNNEPVNQQSGTNLLLSPFSPMHGFKKFYKISALLDKRYDILKNDTLVLRLRMKWWADEGDPRVIDVPRYDGRKNTLVVRTSFKVTNRIVDWYIDSASLKLVQPGQYLESQPNSVDTEEMDSFSIQIHPREKLTGSEEEYVSIFLKPIMKNNEGEEEVSVHFTVTLLDAEKQKINEKSARGRLPNNSPGWGFTEFCKTSDLLGKDKNFKNSTLLLTVDLKVLVDVDASSMVVVNKYESEVTFTTSNLGELLTDPELVRLQVGDRDFHVSKSVLTTRSAVFAAMLEDALCDSITIDDVEPGIMAEVLGYVYTGRFPPKDELAERILPVADRYQLEGLKHWCCQVLGSGLDIDSAYRTLVLAHRHRADALKVKIIDFLVDNSGNVLRSDAWRRFNDDHPQLANHVNARMLEQLDRQIRLM